MPKTIRVDNKVHGELVSVQGEMQAERKKMVTLSEAIDESVKAWRLLHKRSDKK